MAAKRATTPYKPTITSWVGCVVFGNHNKSSIEPTYAPLGARKVGNPCLITKGNGQFIGNKLVTASSLNLSYSLGIDQINWL